MAKKVKKLKATKLAPVVAEPQRVESEVCNRSDLCVTFKSATDINNVQLIKDNCKPYRKIITEYDGDNEYYETTADDDRRSLIYDAALAVARTSGTDDVEEAVRNADPRIAESYITNAIHTQAYMYAAKWNNEISFALAQATRVVLDYIRANFIGDIYDRVLNVIGDSRLGLDGRIGGGYLGSHDVAPTDYYRYAKSETVNVAEIKASTEELELISTDLRNTVMRMVVSAYDEVMGAVRDAVYLYHGSNVADANKTYISIEEVASSIFQSATQEFLAGVNSGKMIIDYAENHAASFPGNNLSEVMGNFYRSRRNPSF